MHVPELLMRLIILIGVLLDVEATYSAAQPAEDVGVKHPSCQAKCGNVSIPYPFGTTEDCYHDEQFLITCDNTTNPPMAFLMGSNINVTNISIIEGKLRILQFIGYDCYNESGGPVGNFQPSLNLSKFIISNTDNKFVAVGCDTQAYIQGYQANQRICSYTKQPPVVSPSTLGGPRPVISGPGTLPDPPITTGGIGDPFTRSTPRKKICRHIKETAIQNKKYTTGCIARCGSKDYVANNACSGLGCCQTSIPEGMTNFTVTVSSYDNHTEVYDFNPCSYAFVVEERKFIFSSIYLSNHSKGLKLPAVLDWSIGNENCTKNSSACKENSKCYDLENGPGYRCKCNEGYDGNPYLGCLDIDECKDPNLNECMNTTICKNTEGNYTCSCPFGYLGDGRKSGDRCPDIDECKHPNSNKCIHKKSCKNTEGNYTCSCPNGYHGDGRIHGDGCIANPSDQSIVTEITVGVGASIMILLMGSSWFYMGHKKWKLIKLKEKFFRQNGGLILQQQLSSSQERSTEMTKIFTAEELKKATNNYDESRIVGKGGYGTVYKGNLTDGRIVAIKKSKIVDQGQIEQFINEVIVLSQINHRNVVKLLGCCLETEVPLLVYEFVTNGTLFDHIHKSKASTISWETRLRIAAETAGVLSYLHSSAATPIIHRDVKSTNILLDNSYTAKVSDFGASRLVPLDQTELTTLVQGTLGYLDPEYMQTSQLTEKSDVYSFGVVLVELLTGKKALSFDRPEKERNLSMYFLFAMKEDRLLEILEDCIVHDGSIEQFKEVADIAKRCLRMKGEDRPTMKEVAMELEGLRIMVMHLRANGESYSEETNYLLSEPSCSTIHVDDIGSMSTGYDSSKSQMLPVHGGR